MISTLPGSTAHLRETPFSPAPALVTASSVVGLLVVAAYAVGVLAPYLANDLHHLSYAELTSGAHDPKDLWPAGGGVLGGLVHLAGLGAVLIGWLVTAPAAVVSALALRTGLARRATRLVLLHAVILTLLMSSTLLTFTPLGIALMTWSLD